MRSCTLILAICVLAPCAVHAQQSWERNDGGPSVDRGYSVQQTSDGGYIVAGHSNSFGDPAQVYLIKTDANGNIGIEETPSADVRTRNAGPTIVRGVLLLPPPTFTLHSSLFSLSGQKVLGLHSGANDISRLAPGVYFVHSSIANRQSQMSKVIVSR
jgi:hypothetical protein